MRVMRGGDVRADDVAFARAHGLNASYKGCVCPDLLYVGESLAPQQLPGRGLRSLTDRGTANQAQLRGFGWWLGGGDIGL
jgi:hypothetical protein